MKTKHLVLLVSLLGCTVSLAPAEPLGTATTAGSATTAQAVAAGAKGQTRIRAYEGDSSHGRLVVEEKNQKS